MSYRAADERPALLLLADLLLRHRRLLIGLPLLFAIAAGALTLLRAPEYSAESRFMPHAPQRNNSGLAGLAAQFGVNVGGGSANESPEFYAALIKTRDLLQEAASTHYNVSIDGTPARGTLVQLLRTQPADDPEKALHATVDRLAHEVSTRPEPRTGMVIVRTIAPSPELAVAINTRLLDLVSEFNLKKRQTQAAAEREFVQGRVREAQDELETAESALETFMERNRQYTGSPNLVGQAERLQRRVQLRQEVYTSLAQAYEQARVDEVRNTPVITVVDRPEGTVRRVGSGVTQNVVFGFVIGVILAIAFALISERLARESQLDPQAYARLRARVPLLSRVRVPGALFLVAVLGLLALPATAEAQQRPPTASDTARIRQEAQQRLGRSVSQAELIERLRQSGMTRAQVRQRLAQAGYNPALADAYFDVLERGGEPGRGAADSTFVQALVRIGVAVPGVVVPLPDSALSVQDSTLREEAATGELQVFGRSVFRRGTEFNALALGPVDPDYRIGPGDELFLWLTGDVELAYTLDVSREGTIVIPDVGQVPVSGLTLGMLQDRLYDRLGRVYSGVRRGAGATTQFQVSIGRLRASQVYVIGDVLDPGAKQVSSVGTALNALHVAGGPTDRGSFRRIEVRRGGRVIGIVDLYDYLVNGDASSDVRLEHGDRVFVPPVGAQVRVQGSVRRPAIYEMRPGEGLRDVLTFAGGLEPDAIVRRVQIDRVLPPAERTPGRYRVVRDIELEQLFAPNTTLPLQDGDVVHVLAVPDEVRERVWIVGAVNNPGLFEWSDGLTLGQLITRADGLADPAYRSRLQIYRRDPATGERSMVSAEAPATGDIGPPLADGDSVVVLSRSQLANPAFVAVDGFVKEPGDYSYMEGMTVRDLILAAGGFVPGANTTEVELSRLTDPLSRTDTTAYVQRVSLGLDSAGAGYRGAGEWPPGAGDIVLSRGDRVFVRRAPGYQPMAEVVVTGEVAAPGTYILQTRQDRVTDVLHRAGWLTDQAHRDGVRVSRGGTIVAANLERALANESDRANIRLEPGDSIHVAAYDPTVTIAGAVTFSARALHREGRGLDYYLDQAGGTVENADRDRITVTYPNGERARVRNVLWMERSPDIKPGSVIFVPFKPEGETGVDIDQLLSRTLTIITTAVTLLVAVNQLK